LCVLEHNCCISLLGMRIVDDDSRSMKYHFLLMYELISNIWTLDETPQQLKT
jgi:hypothetical protein